MIPRTLRRKLVQLARRFPIVTVTGPRQSGKTTLCRMTFPRKPYVSLEAPDLQAYARADPRGFLASYASGAILDEVQRVPSLLSYGSFSRDRPTSPCCTAWLSRWPAAPRC
jgi:predicted AAA+ superfamily ATPase